MLFDLLYLSALLDIRINRKEITQQKMPLVGFNGCVTMSIGTIHLSISIESAIIFTNFVVLNASISYNAISRPIEASKSHSICFELGCT